MNEQGPSLGVAWGWTWRVFICLLPIALIVAIVIGIFSALADQNERMDRQSKANASGTAH